MNRELMQRISGWLNLCNWPAGHVAQGFAAELRAAMAEPVAPAEPAEGWVLVPKRMTQEMRDVTDSEGWTWEDLLAEAGSISQEEYAAIAAAIKYHMGEDCEAPT